jgi:hypothetical protein
MMANAACINIGAVPHLAEAHAADRVQSLRDNPANIALLPYGVPGVTVPRNDALRRAQSLFRASALPDRPDNPPNIALPRAARAAAPNPRNAARPLV